MNRQNFFRCKGTGAAILGIALCVPMGMQAQQTPPPQAPQGVAVPRTNEQTALPYHAPYGPPPKRQLKHLTRMLNLTPDQQQQMLPILKDRAKQIGALRQDTSLDPQQRQQKMRALMQDTRQKLEAVMTADQKQQFEQKMQEQRQRMRARRMQPNGGPPPSNAPGQPDAQGPAQTAPNGQTPPPQG